MDWICKVDGAIWQLRELFSLKLKIHSDRFAGCFVWSSVMRDKDLLLLRQQSSGVTYKAERLTVKEMAVLQNKIEDRGHMWLMSCCLYM